ncbi:MAG: acyl carrier protein, partial [Pseudomonadota bacterium]
ASGIADASISQLGPDVYLLSRDPDAKRATIAPRRRDVLTWVPKALGALAALGLAGQALAEEKTIEARLIEILTDDFGLSDNQINFDARFSNDLGFDSLDTVEFIMAVETEFGIEVPDQDAERFLDVGTVVKYLEGERF